MARRGPKTHPITERIARQTGVSQGDIQYILDNYVRESGEGPCLPWSGRVNIATPVIKKDGRPQSVRRVLDELATGEPTPQTTQLQPGCATLYCVNPQHSLHKLRVLAQAEEPSFELVDSPEDVIDAVLSRDRPWLDPQALATEFDYPLQMVLDAIASIEEQGL